MHEFVDDGMLHVLLIEKVSLAKHDCACVGGETARMSEVAWQAREVSWRGVCTGMLEMVEHELYRRAYAPRKQGQMRNGTEEVLAVVQEILLPSLAVTTVDGEDAVAWVDAITRK